MGIYFTYEKEGMGPLKRAFNESVLYSATLANLFFFRVGGINDVESGASLGGIAIVVEYNIRRYMSPIN